jgi:hypothetical protein
MSAQEQRITTRSEDAFDANERVARAAETHRFVSRVPMFCECDDQACQALVLVELERYHEIRRDRSLYLTAPAHRLEGAEPVERAADLWIQRVGA